MTLVREKITGPAGAVPAGHTVLILRGAKGAITLSAWQDVDTARGCLGIHAEGDGEGTCPCEYVPSGFCYADQGFRIGYEEAPSILAGYDARAWVLMYQFYCERIDPEEASDVPE